MSFFKKPLATACLISSTLVNNAYANWSTASSSDSIHSVFIEEDSDGLKIMCNTQTNIITILYYELDNSTRASDAQRNSLSLLLSSDGEELTKRNKVTFRRQSSDIIALISEVNNMPATTRKILRGLRDASQSITISAKSHMTQKIVFSSAFSPRGSAQAINEFASKCGIEI